ncbi:hypothetical protein V1478_002023 [Vespula squamosa]|uniref:Uncharacterized protein n=1 Tax=Vespula squamosa TaxID=30214 RepID=A0ABD2BYT1_VESSQ
MYGIELFFAVPVRREACECGRIVTLVFEICPLLLCISKLHICIGMEKNLISHSDFFPLRSLEKFIACELEYDLIGYGTSDRRIWRVGGAMTNTARTVRANRYPS